MGDEHQKDYYKCRHLRHILYRLSLQEKAGFVSICMHDYHPAVLPTSLLSNPCSNLLIHRPDGSVLFLQRCIIAVCGMAIFDWKETSHRDEKYGDDRSEEHTSELQSQSNLVCRLLLEKK